MSTGTVTVNQGAFYFGFTCPDCDAELYDGVCLTLLEHNGLPVVPVDMACNTSFECTECGAVSTIGELDVITEDGAGHPGGDTGGEDGDT